jgi:hypothetical protein
VYDALRRKFQCATVQLDFQLPIRFGLQARSKMILARRVWLFDSTKWLSTAWTCLLTMCCRV